MNVENHRATGIRDVGQVTLASCQFPNQPRIHRAKCQFSSFRFLPGSFYIFQDPSDFGSGKIGVDDQAGLRCDLLRMAFFLELIAVGGSSSVLPNDGMIERFAGFTIPDNGRFPLIGDADGSDLVGAYAFVNQGFDHDSRLAGPDFVRVMLNPALLGKVLLEFLLGDGDDLPFLVKNNGS